MQTILGETHEEEDEILPRKDYEVGKYLIATSDINMIRLADRLEFVTGQILSMDH